MKVSNISKSLISRHLTGELERPEVDIYIIEQLLGIKIEGYRYRMVSLLPLPPKFPLRSNVVVYLGGNFV